MVVLNGIQNKCDGPQGRGRGRTLWQLSVKGRMGKGGEREGDKVSRLRGMDERRAKHRQCTVTPIQGNHMWSCRKCPRISRPAALVEHCSVCTSQSAAYVLAQDSYTLLLLCDLACLSSPLAPQHPSLVIISPTNDFFPCRSEEDRVFLQNHPKDARHPRILQATTVNTYKLRRHSSTNIA